MQSDTSESLHPRITLEIIFWELLISYCDSGVLLRISKLRKVAISSQEVGQCRVTPQKVCTQELPLKLFFGNY